MQDFITYAQKVKKYSDRTIKSYAKAIEVFSMHLDYKTATSKQISEYLSTLKSNHVKNITIASLNMFYKFKLRNGEISNNPMSAITYFKCIRRAVIPITVEEMKSMIVEDNFHTKEDYILFETLYLTGMRINELASLKQSNIINSGSSAIRITGKGNKQRIVYLEKHAVDNLLSICKNGKVGSYSAYTLRLRMSMYLKDFHRVGLTKTTKTSSHVLRHSFATHLHKDGANILTIKNFLGHSSVATTQFYTHVDLDFLKSQHKKMRK